MKKRAWSICFGMVLLAGCGAKTGEPQKPPAAGASALREKESISSCLPPIDTVLASGSYVKAAALDTFFGIRIGLQGMDTLLGYRFDCSAPSGLVPKYHSSAADAICLLRGYGFNYREFILAYRDSNRLLLKYYETAVATGLSRNRIIYRTEDEKLVVENFRTDRKLSFDLPERVRHLPILESFVSDKNIRLVFENERLDLRLKE